MIDLRFFHQYNSIKTGVHSCYILLHQLYRIVPQTKRGNTTIYLQWTITHVIKLDCGIHRYISKTRQTDVTCIDT